MAGGYELLESDRCLTSPNRPSFAASIGQPLSRKDTSDALGKTISQRSAAIRAAEGSKRFCGCCGLLQRLVIVPEETWWLPYWDMWIVALLFLTTYYEPYAVAVLPEDPIWALAVNHVLDLTFTTDMLLTFFIAYGQPLESAADNSLWVKDIQRIAQRYCAFPLTESFSAGWFWIDLVTVLPGWLEMVLPEGKPESSKFLVLFRLLRLVRLTKLFRVQQLLLKWHQHYGYPFYVVDLGKFFFITTVTVHWMACVWIIIEGRVSNGKLSYRTEQESWLSALINAKGDSCTPSADKDPNCVYAISLYWATMTLTTVGYGDITSQNPVEYIVGTICMFVVAYVWAYVLGKMVTLLESVDRPGEQFKQSMDLLQTLMQSKCLPHSLQVRLRRYMHEAHRTSMQLIQRNQLHESISQSLQREVAQCSGIAEKFQRGVFWAEGLQQDALLDLVRALVPHSFGPGEIMMLPQTLLFMRRGISAVKGRILNRGDIWGQVDILLTTEALIDSAFPRSLSYVDILALSRDSLVEVCSTFPHADKRVRRAQIRTAVFRAFIKTARDCSSKPRLTYSGLPPSAATSFVNPGLNKLHMSGVQSKDETKLSDLKYMLTQGLTELRDDIFQIKEDQRALRGELKQEICELKQELTHLKPDTHWHLTSRRSPTSSRGG